MLEKQIESVFTDPAGGQSEYEKHAAHASEHLGANPVLIHSSTQAVIEQITEMVERTREVLAGHKLVTRWRARDADTA